MNLCMFGCSIEKIFSFISYTFFLHIFAFHVNNWRLLALSFMEHLFLFCYSLGSKLRLMLKSMKAMFRLDFWNALRASHFGGSDLVQFYSFFFNQVSSLTDDSN